MSHTYSKVTTDEKKWPSQNFDFLGLNICHQVSFGDLQFTKISLNFTTSYSNQKNRGLGAKLCVAFLLFSLWKELWRFKVNESMHFVEQKDKP